MFVDKIDIHVKGGNGGNGAVSFYRAKYITNGGPNGGDGGKGGDVIFVADGGLSTLMDFRYKRKFKAEPGANGGKLNCSGKAGADVLIRVPVGTLIREKVSGKVIADMSEAGVERIIIKGGKGGRGNQHFATPKRQAPQYAESGRLAKELELTLELKLIADVAIIGLPNAGKSSLLAMVTNANPKIAAYQFTTLSPNLGVVRTKYFDDFVLADIPGLIEGASEGVGLGHEFLRHIERTRVFIHVVDGSQPELMENIEIINNELKQYNEELLTRPMVLAVNKMDLPEALEQVEQVKARYGDTIPIFPISAATGSGLEELIKGVCERLKDAPEVVVFEEDYEEFDELTSNEPFTIECVDGVFDITGHGLLRTLRNTGLDNEKGFAFFQKYLRDKGIIKMLEEMGIEDGDTVKIYDLMFDYYK